jgi:hypothetical protein
MNVHPMAPLSRAIDAAFEAAVFPVLVLAGVVLLVLVISEVSARLRRRGSRAPRTRPQDVAPSRRSTARVNAGASRKLARG